MRMLAAALWRHIATAAFQDFEKRLLNTFARDIPSDADVIGLSSDLVDFIYVHDADLGALYIVLGILQKAQNDILNVFTDVAGFGQRGSVRNAKRHIENSSERPRQKGLSRAG